MFLKLIHLVAQCSKITNTGLTQKHYITYFCYLPLSTSNVRMSEGTFCHVEVHIYKSSVRFVNGTDLRLQQKRGVVRLNFKIRQL